VKGKKGEPVLISWDDATTMFHEFGHALHGCCPTCVTRRSPGPTRCATSSSSRASSTSTG
jgi:Zn-dependent oligopeptidase